MRERKPEELENYADTARLTVAQADEKGMKHGEVNRHAKRAIELMREDTPSADDDALADFCINMSILTAELMRRPLDQVIAMLERVFQNSTVAAAALLGVYDIEDDSPSPTYATVLEGIKEKLAAKKAHEMREAAEDAGLKIDSEMSSAEWEAMLAKQYL